MELKIDRDEEKCLECMFLNDDLLKQMATCTLFKNNLRPAFKKKKFGIISIEYWIPCNECNLVWRK